MMGKTEKKMNCKEKRNTLIQLHLHTLKKQRYVHIYLCIFAHIPKTTYFTTRTSRYSERSHFCKVIIHSSLSEFCGFCRNSHTALWGFQTGLKSQATAPHLSSSDPPLSLYNPIVGKRKQSSKTSIFLSLMYSRMMKTCELAETRIVLFQVCLSTS